MRRASTALALALASPPLLLLTAEGFVHGRITHAHARARTPAQGLVTAETEDAARAGAHFPCRPAVEGLKATYKRNETKSRQGVAAFNPISNNGLCMKMFGGALCLAHVLALSDIL